MLVKILGGVGPRSDMGFRKGVFQQGTRGLIECTEFAYLVLKIR